MISRSRSGSMGWGWWSRWTLACGWLLVALSTASAQLEFERPPIDYVNAPVQDPIALLQQKLDSGELKLERHPQRGWLDDVLKALEVSETSQMLVFSKTSFQLRRIDPRRPRAVYFNDQVYLGYCQNGDVLEAMAVDPVLGTVFYTLDQDPDVPPRFVRDKGQCLTCHASSRTQGVPGSFVRSVFVDRAGHPSLGSGTFNTDHRSPFEERWGGWYVTGTHGSLRHMGNQLLNDPKKPESLDREAGANVTDLSKLCRIEPYVTSHSDLVALMVLEHQSLVQNRITAAQYEARSAKHYDSMMNAALERPADHQSESTDRRIAAAVDRLVEAMLMVDEYQLPEPVSGTSGFAEHFAAQGTRDRHGRSLRDLDLTTRLFRYPCSYLIETPHFDALPAEVRQGVADRLWKILAEADPDPRFAHLSPEDRTAIREILVDVKPTLWPGRQSGETGATP